VLAASQLGPSGWFVMSGQAPRQRLVEGGATDIVGGGGEAGVAWRRELTGGLGRRG
jgi:hypothetical protein